MSKRRNLLDDIVEGARRLLEEIERGFNPDKGKKRAPVPIPVRPERRLPPDHPYYR